ncbi:MAG: helix-turn-helix domain-containing protein [Clostridia bacterium]|nr:helix-turn-helix domain-containing protein [Clostridia bacterium]
MALKDRIRKCRISNGFTQMQVAQALDIERTAYSSYELGYANPSIDNLCRMSRLFGVTLDELTNTCSGNYELNTPLPQTDEPDYTPPAQVGQLSKDEKRVLMLYRLCADKEEIEAYLKTKAETFDNH